MNAFSISIRAQGGVDICGVNTPMMYMIYMIYIYDTSECVFHIHSCARRRRHLRRQHTHSYAWHDSFICVTWLIHMCGICATWDMCGFRSIHAQIGRSENCIHIWHDSFICDRTHSHVILLINMWHESLSDPFVRKEAWISAASTHQWCIWGSLWVRLRFTMKTMRCFRLISCTKARPNSGTHVVAIVAVVAVCCSELQCVQPMSRLLSLCRQRAVFD